MHRLRIALVLAILSPLMACQVAVHDKLGNKKRPNVLLIVADDLGFNDLAINNGNREIDTPVMDRLAREGVRFTRHYGAAVCSPARAALLTGIAPSRLGFLPNGRGLSPEIVTLPERLQAQGYTTWHIGKWHIGAFQRKAWPDYQGFDHWYGFLDQWRLAGTHVNGQIVPAMPRYMNPWLQGDEEAGRNVPGHLEDILTDKAVAVLSELRNTQNPWFLNLWFYAPHSPVQPAEKFAQRYPNTRAGRYQALVNQLDTNIGRVLEQLEALGMTQNTIVVVVSDNGGTNTHVDNNAPYFGKKSTLLEGGIRTPLIVKWPEPALSGQVLNHTVSIEDIFPTLLESLHMSEQPGIDGLSFYPLVEKSLAPPARELFWEHGVNAASYGVLSSDSRWRLLQTGPIWGARVPSGLYDLEADATGKQRAVPTPVEELAQLQASYDAWYQEAHTVATKYQPTNYGSGELTGMDFQRTPGFEWYTFGIGVPDEWQGQIVSQADVWSMHRSGRRVVAQFGSARLTGDIVSSRPCHSIIVTGTFHRKINHLAPPPKITLAMYIDGVEVHSVNVNGELIVDDPSVVTIIGDPEARGGMGAIKPPTILNTVLDDTTRWSLPDFEKRMCEL